MGEKSLCILHKKNKSLQISTGQLTNHVNEPGIQRMFRNFYLICIGQHRLIFLPYPRTGSQSLQLGQKQQSKHPWSLLTFKMKDLQVIWSTSQPKQTNILEYIFQCFIQLAPKQPKWKASPQFNSSHLNTYQLKMFLSLYLFLYLCIAVHLLFQQLFSQTIHILFF